MQVVFCMMYESTCIMCENDNKEGKPMIHAIWLIPAVMAGTAFGIFAHALCVIAKYSDERRDDDDI